MGNGEEYKKEYFAGQRRRIFSHGEWRRIQKRIFCRTASANFFTWGMAKNTKKNILPDSVGEFFHMGNGEEYKKEYFAGQRRRIFSHLEWRRIQKRIFCRTASANFFTFGM